MYLSSVNIQSKRVAGIFEADGPCFINATCVRAIQGAWSVERAEKPANPTLRPPSPHQARSGNGPTSPIRIRAAGSRL
jgi:hypothetical protein